jgi:hypothetical protein
MHLRLLFAGCLLSVAGLIVPLAHADKATSVTVDFSAAAAADNWNWNPLFFKSEGIKFAEFLTVDGMRIPSGYFLYDVQGDAALMVLFPSWRPLSATFTRPVTGISVNFALTGPDVVGLTGRYTLVAYSASGDIVATKTAEVTQGGTGQPGDQFRQPVGFFSIALGDLPSKAKSFSMTGSASFGVNFISYTYG